MLKNILVVAGFIFAVGATAQTSTALPNLQGTYEGTVNGERYVEEWTCRKGVCEGIATSYRGDSVSMQEITRIMEFAGHWHYLVWFGEGPAVSFTLTAADEDNLIFENKDNDFPKLISYTVTTDSLNAYITGPGKDGEMRLDFRLKRVK